MASTELQKRLTASAGYLAGSAISFASLSVEIIKELLKLRNKQLRMMFVATNEYNKALVKYKTLIKKRYVKININPALPSYA